MTLPYERSRSVIAAEVVLEELAAAAHRRGKTVRVPRDLAVRAQLVLRHYPLRSEIYRVAEKCPELFGRIEAAP